MTARSLGALKRMGALMLSVFMILSQIALPAGALAQDVSTLPMLTLHYTEGETTQSVFVAPSLYGTEPVYWATVPQAAFASGLTLEISPSPDETVSYQSANGNELFAWDASAVDGSAVTWIEVYRNGMLEGRYPLYVSSMMMPQPEVIVPQPATISVVYSDSMSGAVLKSFSDVYYAGEHAFTPNANMLPENYTLDNENPVYVTVFEDGTATQYEVVFFATYSEPVVEPQPATISVIYTDSYTGAVLNSFSDVYYAGEHAFTPNANMLPENYTLDNENPVYVTVFEDGTATQYEVVFFATYSEPVVEPQPATISVIYTDSYTGAVLNSFSDVYYAGEHAFAPNANMLPENYTLDNENPVYVTVFEDGTATQYEVVFFATYNEPVVEPQPATISVIYTDSYTGAVLNSFSDVYYAGEHAFAPNANMLPENYTLDNENPVYVTVFEDGTATQYEVVFFATYSEPQPEEPELPEEPDQPAAPVEATVMVYYVGADGYPVAEESHVFTEGVHTITAHDIDGYTLNADQQTQWQIEVDAFGGVNTPTVLFYVTKIEIPQQPEQPEEPQQPEQPEEPEQPQQPEGPSIPDGATLVEILNCEGKTTTQGLNIRKGPSTGYDKAGKIPVSGTVVAVHLSVSNNEGNLWYQITHEGVTGYVSAMYLELVSAEPVSAEVTIRYMADGAEIPGWSAYTTPLDAGSHPVSGFVAAIDGYTFVSASADVIVIDPNGATPAEVVLTYERNVVNADVTIRHLDQNGAEVASGQIITLSGGSYSAYDYQLAIDGYTFVSASAETIVIDRSGANPAEVLLTYQRNPVTAEVVLQFVDEQGNPLAENMTIRLDEGSFAMAERQLAFAGYTFRQVAPETVTVGANGADAQVVTFTYQRDPVTAEIFFHFVDESGSAIADTTVNPMGEGSYAMADYAQSINGYVFGFVSPEWVNIGANGADVTDVYFTYEREIISHAVTFRYADDQNNAIPGLEPRVETLTEGTWNTSDYAYDAPQGYVYQSASAQTVTIDRNGASPAEVLFTYTRLPDSVVLPVYYLDADRQSLMETQLITFTAADFGKTFSASDYRLDAPSGYEYAGVSSDTVTVDNLGGITPQALEFTYTLKPAAKATVTFEYLSTDGRKVADLLVTELPEGVHDVMEYAANPEKYTFQSVSAQQVTITADGKADPAVITFTYAPVRDKAALKVHYRNAIGEDFAGSPEIRELPVGTHTITPTAAFAPAGYALSASTQSFTVTVGADLVAEPNSVAFTYYDASVTAAVTVRYQDSVNGTIIAEEVRKLTPGTHDLQPDEALIAAKGNYVKSSYNTNSRVIVDESGRADYTTVLFYYQPAETQNYLGYLLVTQQTSLREQPGASANAKTVLPVNTVILTNGQQMSGATEWYSSVVQTGKAANQLGWVSGDHVRRISSDEAAARMEEEKHNQEPEQNPGLYITLMDGVPLRRYKTTASEAKYLKINVVVTVSGQELDDNGYLWHRTRYDGVDGYVRDGQLRKLTADEVDKYLSGGGDTSTGTPEQYNPNGASSYGYITSSGVNFRSEPGGTRIKMLNKYAMALIIGTRNVNGVTWYNVNYSGQVGWVHGDYFHQMSLTEFTSFMGSTEYYQGITNNTAPAATAAPSTGSSSSSTGSATQGNVSSVEDWNVGAWQNTGVNTQATYQPFNPYATPAATAVPNGIYTTEADVRFYQSANTTSGAVTLPKGAEIKITGTITLSSTKWYAVTYDGKTGYVRADDLGSVTATPAPSPTATMAIGTMIPINYEDESKETQTGSVPWGLLAGAVVLVGGAGGVYAYALNQNKRRKAAARAAAARRAQAAAAAGTTAAASPYARRAVAAPNTQSAAPGAQTAAPKPAAPVRNPYASGPITGSTAPAANPYMKPAGTQPQLSENPYAAPAESKPAANPYAAPVESRPAANPYAAPVANPYAAPRAEGDKPAAGSNPYARPIGTVASAPQPDANGETAVRRRATRMQRYHAAEDEE